MAKNIIDCLLDENCTEPIVLEDEKGTKIIYEQIALIPYDKRMYAILEEKELFDNGVENAGVVYYINEEKQKVELVKSDNTIFEIFDIYDRLYEELQGKD